MRTVCGWAAALLLVGVVIWLLARRGRGTTEADARDVTSPAQGTAQPAESEVTYYRYKVVRTYPHDPQAFTQGLVYDSNVLYEGTGLYGQSALTTRELDSGTLIRSERLPRQYFGEGIALVGHKVFQVTWTSQKGFVYDRDTLRLLDEFTYPGEGWGLTYDGRRLILSDGTPTLRFLDPNTYAETARVTVHDRGRLVNGLNELEFIHDRLYANIWPTDSIAVMDPATGRVTGWLDLKDLYPRRDRRWSDDVLNGIAYRPQTNHLLVTGKCWPTLYEIELVPLPQKNEP